MRKILVVMFLVASTFSISAQTYVMSELDGQTIQACTGDFTLGNYTLGETYTLTICSDDSHSRNVRFLAFHYYDFPEGTSLQIYDGLSSDAPLLLNVDHTYNDGLNEYSSNFNNSGCLTLVFTGNAFGASWNAELECQWVCIQRHLNIVSTNPSIEPDGYINVCWDDDENQSMPVEFTAQGTYPYMPIQCED